MKKYLIILVIIILAILVWYKSHPKIAGINWPSSSVIENSGAEDTSIVLKEKFQTYFGQWPSDTSFIIYQDKIKQIEIPADFKFHGFEFKVGGMIETRKSQNELYHDLYLGNNVVIDGLDLHEECVLEFKQKVLYSARCPEFEKVYFKRFIQPKELTNSDEIKR